MDKDSQMHLHQPQRFQNYYELKDKSGFMINDCDHVFKFDKYGGWFDQYGNYYNADGQPENQPQYSDDLDDNQEWSNHVDDEEDEYEKIYGPSAFQQEQDERQQVQQSKQVLEKIAKNMVILQSHDQKTPLRVNFAIIDRKRVPQQKKQDKQQQQQQQPLPEITEIVSRYRKKNIKIINCFYDQEEQEKDQGWFIVKDAGQAEKLIKLQGQKVTGYDFTFDVETLAELLADPLSKVQQEKLELEKKYESVKENQKIFAFIVDGGLDCSKNELKNWFKDLEVKLDIVKMKKNQQGKKIPLIKLEKKNYDKINGKKFNDKNVKLQEYAHKETNEQQTTEV